MNSPNRLTALQARRALESGDLTSEELVRSCLECIEEKNEGLAAFVAYDRDFALEQARAADRASPRKVLQGIPFAVKDVIETRDFDTAYGSSIYAGHRPRGDAACVIGAREHGGVLLGKVATGEFATQTPS